MESPKRHLITCALPYANGPLHIGHVAGCFLPSDIYVRFLRSEGKDVLFVCGTDEHGVPITLKARKEGVTPQEIVDYNHKIIADALNTWGIEFDNFSRTTSPVHHHTAKAFFRDLNAAGGFTEQVTEQFYDPEAEQFLADRYISGTCPNCGNENAYGDQCEKCGRTLSPSELIHPKSTLTGTTPIMKETKNWYLPLDRIQEEFLNDWVESKRDIWKSNVFGQCKSWLNEGLKPRAMTRDLDWGVPVPLDDAEGKVMYVWFDAPIGYISATREILPDDWKTWWKDEGTELTHFLGKDNIVFHTLIFPAMLHEHGGYVLPTHVPANEFLNLEGDKLSTSRNHAVWLHEYLEDFPGKEDELRYVLTAIMPETKDSDFTWADYQARVNNELVAILGNWINRVMVLMHKYFNGVVPASAQINSSVLAEADAFRNELRSHLSSFHFRDGQQALMNIARLGNKYLQDEAPWHAIKEEGGEQKVANVLVTSLELIRSFRDASLPFLPRTAERITHMLNDENGFASGHQLREASLLFKRVEDEEIERQREKLRMQAEMNEQHNTASKQHEPLKAEIVYDDFAKIDLRVGTITAAVPVPKADRLLQLTVDMGFETRTVVSGIAEHFDPAVLNGQQVVVVCNLAPRKLRGIESNGMILMAENADGKLEFVQPGKVVEPGSGVS
ncbi:MAG: methionine--tRNA ligase [Bacteroidetes bacterium]|nr:methionine--tRNA ligase [Bacteroidota bacterium]